MAQRRMFHTDVVESDKFLDLSAGAQLLYFHLGMQADDDGFLIGPKQVCRKLRRPPRDLKELIDAGFLLNFDGIMVIKHFRVANNLRSDRIRPLMYPDIAKQLFVAPTKEYFLEPQGQSETLFTLRGRQLGNQTLPRREENSLEELNREEKKKEEKNIEESSRAQGPSEGPGQLRFMHGTLGKGVLLLSDDQRENLLERLGLDAFNYYTDKLSTLLTEGKVKSKNHYGTIMKWYLEDTEVNDD